MKKPQSKPLPVVDLLHQKSTDELERMKLIREIESLSKNFWKQNFGSLIALIIGLISTGYGIGSGFFNVQLAKQELNAKRLEFDNDRFEIKKTNYQKQIAAKLDSLKLLRSEIIATRREVNTNHSLLEKKGHELDKKNSQLDSLERAYSLSKRKYWILETEYDSPAPIITSELAPNDGSKSHIELFNAGSRMIIEEYRVYLLSDPNLPVKLFTISTPSSAIPMEKELNKISLTFNYRYPSKENPLASKQRINLFTPMVSSTLEAQEILMELQIKSFLTIRYRSISGKRRKTVTWGNKALLKKYKA
jgi:hypothetical protein